MVKDYYYILGVSKTASKSEIRTAYRKLSTKFHPDKNGNDDFFANRFKDINEAHEVLSNPSLKVGYDRKLNNNQQRYNPPSEDKRRSLTPIIEYFKADKKGIKVGEEIELSWKTTNADSIHISSVGKVEKTSISRKIRFNNLPNKETFIITLKAENTKSKKSVSKTIHVKNITYSEIAKEVREEIQKKKITPKRKSKYLLISILIIGIVGFLFVKDLWKNEAVSPSTSNKIQTSGIEEYYNRLVENGVLNPEKTPFSKFQDRMSDETFRKTFYDRQVERGRLNPISTSFEKFNKKFVDEFSSAENAFQINDTVENTENKLIDEEGVSDSNTNTTFTEVIDNSLVKPKIQDTGLAMKFIYEHPNYYKEVQFDKKQSDYGYYTLSEATEKRLVYILDGKNNIVSPPTNSILNIVFRAYAKNPVYHKASNSILIQAARHLLRYDIDKQSWEDIGRCYSFKLFEQGKYQGEIYCPYDRIREENGQSYGRQTYHRIIDINGDESFGTFREIEIAAHLDN